MSLYNWDFDKLNLGDVGYGASSSLGTDSLMSPNYGSVSNIVGNTQMKIPTVANTFSGNPAQNTSSAFSFSDFIKNPFGEKTDYRAEFSKLNPNGSEKQYTDWLQGKFLEQQLDPGFDWGGALNIGLSAFDTFNQYKGQDQMMDYYDETIDIKKDQIDRSNRVKDSYGSAFSQA